MSLGSATGNPRNKVALKPGHSLMDWIRLGSSGKDLAGTGGAYLSVTKAELAQHNKPSDAWICIRGKVYNITSYMDFHPGGPEELMKGAGIDATKIFNEVHAWVNYESILQKCVVGQLRTTCDDDIDITSSLPSPDTPSKPKTSNQQNGATVQVRPPKMDWFQQVGSICMVFYTKTPEPDVLILLDGNNMLCTKINSKIHLLRLESGVNWPGSVTVDANGKVQIRLNKEKPGLWSSFGKLETRSQDIPEYWDSTIVNRIKITHDTYQIDVKYNRNVFNYIPVGHHVLVKASINEEEVERPYTPITSLAGVNIPPVGCLRFIIKSYPTGTLTPWLTSQPIGAKVHVSLPLGSFTLQSLAAANATHLVLLAAGTGFTPMVSLITWALRSSRLTVHLVFFNKTEKDIIWQDHFKQLTDHTRFSVDHILSEPSSTWEGKVGHVSVTLLHSYIPTHSPDIPNTYYVCVCGPMSFTQLTERCLKEDFRFTSKNYFCFLGQ